MALANPAVVPVSVVIEPDAPRSCVVAVVPNVVPVRVVMLAEVLLRLSIVALVDLSVVIVPEVYVAVVPETVVTVALVKLPFVYVRFVPETVPIVAEVAPN